MKTITPERKAELLKLKAEIYKPHIDFHEGIYERLKESQEDAAEIIKTQNNAYAGLKYIMDYVDYLEKFDGTPPYIS